MQKWLDLSHMPTKGTPFPCGRFCLRESISTCKNSSASIIPDNCRWRGWRRQCKFFWWVGLTSCWRLCQLLLMEICQLKCFYNTESTVNMLTFCLYCWLRTLNGKSERQTWDTSLFPQSGQLTGWRRGGKAFCGVDKCSRSWCCSPLGLWASASAATCPWACCPACPRPGGAGRAGGSGWAGKPGGERRTDSGAASPPGYSRVVTGDIISPKIQELVVARNHRFWGLALNILISKVEAS